MKEPENSLFHSSHVRSHGTGFIYEAQALTDRKSTSALILASQTQSCEAYMPVVHKPPSLSYFVMVTKVDEDRAEPSEQQGRARESGRGLQTSALHHITASMHRADPDTETSVTPSFGGWHPRNTDAAPAPRLHTAS